MRKKSVNIRKYVLKKKMSSIFIGDFLEITQQFTKLFWEKKVFGLTYFPLVLFSEYSNKIKQLCNHWVLVQIILQKQQLKFLKIF